MLRFLLPHRRNLATLSLLVHLVVLGLVPVADASQETNDSSRAAVHLELQDDPDCPPAHSHVYCQLCRAVEVRSVPPASPAPIQFSAAVDAAQACAAGFGLCASTSSSSLGARAPPRV